MVSRSLRRRGGDNPRMLPAFVAKLCPRAELQPRLAELPRPIVFTNGVFDILHRGHVTYLAQARARRSRRRATVRGEYASAENLDMRSA